MCPMIPFILSSNIDATDLGDRSESMWGEERSCLSPGRGHKDACLSDVFLCVCSRTKPHTFSASPKSTFISQNDGLSVQTGFPGLTGEQMALLGSWRTKYFRGHLPSSVPYHHWLCLPPNPSSSWARIESDRCTSVFTSHSLWASVNRLNI